MSRRTCAATWTVARSASGNFPRQPRVFRFGSVLWAPRVQGLLTRECDRVSWEGSCGTSLEPSILGLSPPLFAPGCDLSAPGGVPSATQAYPCLAPALPGSGKAPSSLRTSHATRVSVRSPDPHLWRSGTLSCVAPLPSNTDFLC